MASIPGKLFTGYIMEVIVWRWAIFYAFGDGFPASP
jgi:hypothetical protein